MQNLIDLYNQYGEAVAGFLVSVVAAASALSAAIPAPKEGTFWAFVVKTINYLAINFGHAKTTSTTPPK